MLVEDYLIGKITKDAWFYDKFTEDDWDILENAEFALVYVLEDDEEVNVTEFDNVEDMITDISQSEQEMSMWILAGVFIGGVSVNVRFKKSIEMIVQSA